MSETLQEQEEKLEGEEDSRQGDYPFTKVKIERKFFSLFELNRKFKDESNRDILIDPEFQRNNVWSLKQKIELIESILMDIPLPCVYFFQQADGKQQVVDGRQRLTTIFEFMDNEFNLNDLRILKDKGLNGKYFKDFNDEKQKELKVFKTRIEDYQIESYVIQPPTSEKIKFDIFDRVNRGGTRLNNQEMRNALHQGKSTKLLRELANSEEFKKATSNSISDKRMKGRYMIIRFFSFYMLKSEITYKGDIDDFLAKAMDFINKLNDDKIEVLKKIFLQAMRKSYEIVGEDCFRFTPNNDRNRRTINMVLFEALTFLFCNDFIDFSQAEKLKNKIESAKKEFDDSGNFSSPAVEGTIKVNKRFEAIDKLIEELKND